MRQHERHKYIVGRVNGAGFVAIEKLAEELSVTPQTIRRDLSQLEQNHEIRRFHGGAGTLEYSTENTAYKARKQHQSEQKAEIGRQVANYIPDGSSIFINIGTTTEAVANFLKSRQRLQVVTNNLHVAAILSGRDDFKVIVSGGEVRSGDGGIVGEAAVDLVEQYRMDFAIIGVSGISEDGTLLDFDYREVRVSQMIIQNAREVILCADRSKFGRNAMIKLGHISQINHLFTDQMPCKDFKQLLDQHKVQLHCIDELADP